MVKFILIILFPISLFGIDYIDLQDPSFEFYYDSNEITIGPDSIGNFSGMLLNNSSIDIGIAMIRRDSNLNESWSSSICIGSICYNETIDSASTTINAGDSVHFVNNMLPPHNVVVEDHDELSHEALAMMPGEEFDITFSEVGDYTFWCGPHKGAGMIGTIHVN